MNIEGFEELRDSVLEMICRIKVPKYKLAQVSKNFDNTTVEGLSKAINEILYEEEEVKESQFKRELEDFWNFQEGLKETNRESYIQLCLPGSIIQLFRNVGQTVFQDKSGEDMGQYTARWANRIDFRHIHISPRLLLDHDIVGVKLRLQELAQEQFGLHPPFIPRLDSVEP